MKYSECVCIALDINCEIGMRRIAIACPALQYFSTLSHEGHDFRIKSY